jgi:hypothetical protein
MWRDKGRVDSPTRSHAPRGNAVFDAPRRESMRRTQRFALLTSPDAERRRRHSHAERGNERILPEIRWNSLDVPLEEVKNKVTMNPAKAQESLHIAQELATHAKSSTDLHNAFFGVGGKFGELFPTRAEREEFAQTPEYQEIMRIRESLRKPERVAS